MQSAFNPEFDPLENDLGFASLYYSLSTDATGKMVCWPLTEDVENTAMRNVLWNTEHNHHTHAPDIRIADDVSQQARGLTKPALLWSIMPTYSSGVIIPAGWCLPGYF